jgi:hypothetical protein
MCGGETFLDDFDLTEFCAILQSLVPEIQVVPAPDPKNHPRNVQPPLVSADVFNKAVLRYCQD